MYFRSSLGHSSMWPGLRPLVCVINNASSADGSYSNALCSALVGLVLLVLGEFWHPSGHYLLTSSSLPLEPYSSRCLVSLHPRGHHLYTLSPFLTALRPCLPLTLLNLWSSSTPLPLSSPLPLPGNPPDLITLYSPTHVCIQAPNLQMWLNKNTQQAYWS